MSKGFFDFFPAPRFLEMPAPGLSLTDAGVRLIEFKQEGGNFVLKQHGEVIFPKDIIISGAIKDAPELVNILKDFRKKHDVEYIRTMLPEERAYLFRTKVQNIRDRDIRTSVEFTIEENVPVSVSETVFDYTVLSETKGEDGSEMLDVSVSVIQQDVVNEYLEVFQQAGFTPLHFEVESQAVTKAVVPRNDRRTLLIVNIGRFRAGIYVVSDETVSFSSTVPISLPQNNQNKDLTEDGLEYTRLDKEGKKIETKLSQGYAGFDTAIAEIKKIFLFWKSQTDKVGLPIQQIETILICGDEGHRPGIAEYIEKQVKIPAHIGDVWTNVFSFHDYVPDIPLEESLSYAGAIGLALSHNITEKK